MLVTPARVRYDVRRARARVRSRRTTMRMRTRAELLNFFHFSNEYLVSKGKREELKQSRPLCELSIMTLTAVIIMK